MIQKCELPRELELEFILEPYYNPTDLINSLFECTSKQNSAIKIKVKNAIFPEASNENDLLCNPVINQKVVKLYGQENKLRFDFTLKGKTIVLLVNNIFLNRSNAFN